MTAVTNAEFLEALFCDLPDGAAAMVCGFKGDPRPDVITDEDRKRWFADPWAFDASPKRCSADRNNYVAVSSFYPDAATGEHRRRKAAFSRLHAVMLDDLGDGPGAKLPLRHAHRLPVSALIETSPRNFQAWIFLQPEEATDTRATAERLIDCMIEQGLAANADPGMSGVTRYGRLPVGINGKARYLRDGEPFRVRLTEWNPDRRYSAATVAQAFGLNMTQRATVKPPVAPSTVDAKQRQDEFGRLLVLLSDAGLYQGEASPGVHQIICPWAYEHTGGDPSGTAIFAPSEQNAWAGGFRCHHGHGGEINVSHVRSFVRELARAIGIRSAA